MRQIDYLFFIYLLITIISFSEVKARNCNHDKNTFRCVKYVKNYDGDTVTFNIDGVHPLFGNKINIRINGIDTPEIRTKISCEKQQAKVAKKLVASLLKKAKTIDLTNIKRGKYFRIVADVIVDGVDIKEILVQKKLAYRYYGGKKRKVEWCSFREQRLPASKD